MIKFVIVASRGRNPENPSDRRAGIHTEQRIEPNLSGTTNVITSVAKDNWYAISSFETTGIDPSQAVIKDYANAAGTAPYDSSKAANLQNKGFWFKIVNIPVAEDVH